MSDVTETLRLAHVAALNARERMDKIDGRADALDYADRTIEHIEAVIAALATPETGDMSERLSEALEVLEHGVECELMATSFRESCTCTECEAFKVVRAALATPETGKREACCQWCGRVTNQRVAMCGNCFEVEEHQQAVLAHSLDTPTDTPEVVEVECPAGCDHGRIDGDDCYHPDCPFPDCQPDTQTEDTPEGEVVVTLEVMKDGTVRICAPTRWYITDPLSGSGPYELRRVRPTEDGRDED